MGEEHTYRYVNASNVYAKGKADGVVVKYYTAPDPYNRVTYTYSGTLLFAGVYRTTDYGNYWHEDVILANNNKYLAFGAVYQGGYVAVQYDPTASTGNIININTSTKKVTMMNSSYLAPPSVYSSAFNVLIYRP